MAISCLRADPNLPLEAARAISGVVRETYQALAVQLTPRTDVVACHLRAASTLRPGVAERLAGVLRDIHDELERQVKAGTRRLCPAGSRANAEKQAQDCRRDLAVAPTAALDLMELGRRLGVGLVSADTLIDRSWLDDPERLQAFTFSAATFIIGGRRFIVTNPVRTPGRLTSDVAHELAHLLLDHDLTEIQEIAGVPFRTCSPGQEDQATALGCTLLLPRPLLLAAANRGLDSDRVATAYGVTTEMARYRYSTTGVAKQIQRRVVRSRPYNPDYSPHSGPAPTSSPLSLHRAGLLRAVGGGQKRYPRRRSPARDDATQRVLTLGTLNEQVRETSHERRHARSALERPAVGTALKGPGR